MPAGNPERDSNCKGKDPMKIERGTAMTPPYWTVLVEANELVTASGKTVPYCTWIGTISAKGITLWRPCGYLPRDYKPAAMALLEQAQQQLREEGKIP